VTVRGEYPPGSDTLELSIEDGIIVARCTVCVGLPVIGLWPNTVSLLAVVHALIQHQETIAPSDPTPEENDA
jgi:hypothetical protein